MKLLDRRRFEALAGYVRFPYSFLFAEELAWFEEGDEKLLGLVSQDVSDGDYVLTVLARDAVNRYRAVDVTDRPGDPSCCHYRTEGQTCSSG